MRLLYLDNIVQAAYKQYFIGTSYKRHQLLHCIFCLTKLLSHRCVFVVLNVLFHPILNMNAQPLLSYFVTIAENIFVMAPACYRPLVAEAVFRRFY